MKKILLSVLSILMVLGSVGVAGATVLKFDDITTNPSANFTDYGGLNWEAARAVETQEAVSGGYALGNLFFSPAASIPLGTFDFLGAYFFTPTGNDISITVSAYLEGNFQDNQTTLIGATPSWVGFTFTGIDRLVFTPNPLGSSFAMDNFTYNSNPVPEPATMLLLGTGLIGLAGFRKKVKK